MLLDTTPSAACERSKTLAARLRAARVWEFDLHTGRVLDADAARVRLSACAVGCLHIMVAAEPAVDARVVHALGASLAHLVRDTPEGARITVTIAGVMDADAIQRVADLFTPAPGGGAWKLVTPLAAGSAPHGSRIKLQFVATTALFHETAAHGAASFGAVLSQGASGAGPAVDADMDRRAVAHRYLRGDTESLPPRTWRWDLMSLPPHERVDVPRTHAHDELLHHLRAWCSSRRGQEVIISRQHPAAGARTVVARAVHDFIMELQREAGADHYHDCVVCPWLGPRATSLPGHGDREPSVGTRTVVVVDEDHP
ncbi:hypothetical protein EON62_06475, partial [archaeon]